jgi:murein L,D-transpeptidase YcbB/YkuD
MSVSYTVKRSVSPDGKIDAVSVETTFSAEANDTQAVLDAIAESNKYANYVQTLTPAPRTYAATQTSGTEETSSPTGLQTLTGAIQAVFPGEKSPTSQKMGPGAIIIDGIKVKTFDKDIIQHAKNMKDTGVTAKAVFIRNEKWKSNDLKALEAVGA